MSTTPTANEMAILIVWYDGTQEFSRFQGKGMLNL